MIGKKAPEFSCEAVVEGKVRRMSLADFKDCYKIIFFYPQDFTFVCPTELHAFQDKLDAFKERNVAVIGCSVDDATTHCQWMKTSKCQGGIEGVCYPLLADCDKEIARAYGVLDEDAGVAYRGLFFLDKDNVIQSLIINNMSLGRNIDEVLRLIDALQFVEGHGQVCPANWESGKPAMDANKEGLRKFFSKKRIQK